MRAANWKLTTEEFNRVIHAKHEKIMKRQRRSITRMYANSSATLSNDLASFILMVGNTPDQIVGVLKAVCGSLKPEQVHEIANQLSRYADQMERQQKQ